MVQAITHRQSIIEEIENLTPQQQEKVLEFIKFLLHQTHNTEIKQAEAKSPVDKSLEIETETNE